ncbi:hypothetical protein BpHYR1_007864 [Brachionus plicatilis]|uniref:Uncharacterized protein n=1 Tax=Brachionus plicatilis TaxID=10195 RepID=A0A3M7STZ3_BRAPC|nr:hypothetical protein BpHYR1_007864 [Brachionus plicatilis]
MVHIKLSYKIYFSRIKRSEHSLLFGKFNENILIWSAGKDALVGRLGRLGRPSSKVGRFGRLGRVGTPKLPLAGRPDRWRYVFIRTAKCCI